MNWELLDGRGNRLITFSECLPAYVFTYKTRNPNPAPQCAKNDEELSDKNIYRGFYYI